MTALELDALAARIAAGSGPDRALDAEFAREVCGWANVKLYPRGWLGDSPSAKEYPRRLALPEYTDTDGAGPGALFAAARALWPDGSLAATQSGTLVPCRAVQSAGLSPASVADHPDLSRALMLAITAAKRAEIAGGNAP